MILLDQAADDHHIRGCPENVVQRQPIISTLSKLAFWRAYFLRAPPRAQKKAPVTEAEVFFD